MSILSPTIILFNGDTGLKSNPSFLKLLNIVSAKIQQKIKQQIIHSRALHRGIIKK